MSDIPGRRLLIGCGIAATAQTLLATWFLRILVSQTWGTSFAWAAVSVIGYDVWRIGRAFFRRSRELRGEVIDTRSSLQRRGSE